MQSLMAPHPAWNAVSGWLRSLRSTATIEKEAHQTVRVKRETKEAAERAGSEPVAGNAYLNREGLWIKQN